MFNSVAARARETLDQAYLAVPNWNTNPANIPLPDVVNTKRPKLSREQMVERYLASIEGRKDLDIKKTPSMKSRNAPQIEFIQQASTSPENTKRAVNCQPVFLPYYSGEKCDSVDFLKFKSYAEEIAMVNVDVIGIDPECACLVTLPQFFICADNNLEAIYRNKYSDRYVRDTLYKLDYRNFSFLRETNYCQSNICPAAETEQMAINRQIDETIDEAAAKSFGSTIYLNNTMLNDYLLWRKYNGKPDNFSYIVISDKPSGISSSPNIGGFAAGFASGFAAAVTAAGAAFGAIRLVNYCRGREEQSQTVTVDERDKAESDVMVITPDPTDSASGSSSES